MSAFIDALARASVPVIMELKPRDADGRDLFAGRTPAELVATYERLGAPCLSVVTGSWFGGDDALLREVAALTERPVLKKDFVTSERQIAAAKAQGASAVLLTAELLPGSLTARLADACRRHSVTPFVEISDATQLERLGDAHGCVVAVNNKDIRRRERGEARIERSLELLPAVVRSGAECAVSAGGIAERRVAAKLLDAGYDALLIGTALLDGMPRTAGIEGGGGGEPTVRRAVIGRASRLSLSVPGAGTPTVTVEDQEQPRPIRSSVIACGQWQRCARGGSDDDSPPR